MRRRLDTVETGDRAIVGHADSQLTQGSDKWIRLVVGRADKRRHTLLAHQPGGPLRDLRRLVARVRAVHIDHPGRIELDAEPIERLDERPEAALYPRRGDTVGPGHEGDAAVPEVDEVPDEAPDGVVSVPIDTETGELATSACPKVETEYYLVGTQPTQFCHLHGGGGTQIAGWDTNPPAAVTVPAANGIAPENPAASAVLGQPPAAQTAQNTKPPKPDKKKKSFFDKLKGVFK